MAATLEHTSFERLNLQREIMKLRRADNFTNLLFLAMEYLCLIAIAGGTIVFAQFRDQWQLSWWWNVPVFALAIVLIGGIQHRLAGLGHEGAHYAFLKNRFLNDLIVDVFCMFPLLATVHFYRLFHLAHHQFTNDPSRDPDLLNLGHGKRADEFPMTRGRFVRVVYFGFLVAPSRFVRYQLAYIELNALGGGKNVYVEQSGSSNPVGGPRLRLGTILGLVYLFAISEVFSVSTSWNRPEWLAPAGLIGIALAAATIRLLPDSALFSSPLRAVYSTCFASVLRVSFYTIVLAILARFHWGTDGISTIYAIALWFVPLVTSFMFFMFLRDVYQHSNAGVGRLTNSRVFFTDPFTRWAVFVYGQDMHIPHHLFPGIPHYRLRRLHELLKRNHAAYHDEVVETHGTFRNRSGYRTILDVMTGRRVVV
jgi:fatty acid desaturase